MVWATDADSGRPWTALRSHPVQGKVVDQGPIDERCVAHELPTHTPASNNEAMRNALMRKARPAYVLCTMHVVALATHRSPVLSPRPQ